MKLNPLLLSLVSLLPFSSAHAVDTVMTISCPSADIFQVPNTPAYNLNSCYDIPGFNVALAKQNTGNYYYYQLCWSQSPANTTWIDNITNKPAGATFDIIGNIDYNGQPDSAAIAALVPTVPVASNPQHHPVHRLNQDNIQYNCTYGALSGVFTAIIKQMPAGSAITNVAVSANGAGVDVTYTTELEKK